ncbi:MAG: hypothetical protein IKX62_02795 [Bacteroidales bacterium]|nr:hypothetical protein [Bacteroidales bacterium]
MAKNTFLKLCSRLPVRNCWHFSTDGAYAEVLFRDRTDFVDAMNRIYLLARKHNIVILAFCLMDNHLHFIIYGLLDDCQRFVHGYIRQTSMSISKRFGYRHELLSLPVSYQAITDDTYLKRAICYVHKNPTAANLPYLPQDYPWSSGALLFRNQGNWCSPPRPWTTPAQLSGEERRGRFRTREAIPDSLKVWEDLILPDNYIPIETIERLFWSARVYQLFLGSTRDEDIETRGGAISRLSLPDAELREHRSRISLELFGKAGTRELSTTQRLRLAKELRRRFNSSPKQVARLVGLKFEQVESLL